jgi:O-antigen/teichoic acid export membrane protein
MGIDVANVYFLASRRYKPSDIISNSLISSIGLGLIFILLFWGVSITNAFQEFLNANNIAPTYLWLAVFTLPFALFYTFAHRILLGREEIVKFNSVLICRSFLNLGLVIILLIIFVQGLVGAVFAYILTVIGATLLVTSIVNKFARIHFSINYKLLKESLYYGGKMYLGNIAQFLNYRLDMFLVAYFLNVTAVGHYAVAVGIVEKLWLIPGSMGLVLFPRVSAINEAHANQLTPQVARHTLFIVFIMSVGLLVLANPLIRLLFGVAFLPSVKPLMILLPGIVALSVGQVLSSDLAGRGRTEVGAFASFVSLVVNVPLNFFLIPRWGINGAAFASTVAYILATIILIIVFTGLSKTSYSDILLIRIDDFYIYSRILRKVIVKMQLRGLDK